MEEYDILEDNIGIFYFKKGTNIFHRLDGPAYTIFENGLEEWIVNGKLHRIDGPAIQYWGEDNEWWINGARLSPEKEAIMNMWYENGRV